MSAIMGRLRSFIWVFTALMAGALLFLMLGSLDIDRKVLNPDFHKNLFVKADVYSQTYEVAKSSMAQAINDMKKSSPQNYDQHRDFFTLLEKSVTPEMVKLNLDTFREGIFQYFSGKRIFLPDIYLNRQIKPEAQSSTGVSSYADATSKALTSIDKVNLSAILAYFGRNDITERISALKFIYYALNKLPGFLLLVFLLLTLLGLVLCKKLSDIARWFSVMLFTSSVAATSAFIWLLAYAYFILPAKISTAGFSASIKSNLIIPYIRYCINPFLVFLIAMILVFLVLSAAIILLPRFCPDIYAREHTTKHKPSFINNPVFKKVTIVFLLAYILFAMVYKIQIVKADFKANDFSTTIARMRGISASTQVIPAEDDIIYALQIKLKDDKTDQPVNKIKISIDGKSSINAKEFNLASVTDDNGIARFDLDKGSFRLSFSSDYSPDKYILPSSFIYDLKSAGTTILTINLGAVPSDKDKSGIAEIEVLDRNNKPVPELELSAKEDTINPVNPDNMYSYTNSEGIAVFKVNEGNYKIGFTEAKFPKKYILPYVMDVTVTPDTVSRYTIRLVDSRQR